jgi:hypothetical protein
MRQFVALSVTAVIWWEVGVGLALVPIAAYFWRAGWHSLNAR